MTRDASRPAACTLAALLGTAAMGDTIGAQAPIAIEVTSPTAGEVLDAGVPYTIRWTANRDVYEWFLYWSADGGSTWERIWECMYLTPDARSCTWESPWPVSTAMMVRVTADDAGDAFGAADSEAFTVADRGAGGLPPWWTNGDVGGVGAAGEARFSHGTFTVTGSGADIWGTADEFQFAWRSAGAGFDDETSAVLTARVTSAQNVHRWTKVGVMIRAGEEGPGAAHAAFFATPTTTKGIAFQRRPAAGGQSVHTPGPAITPPLWLKLTRRDRVIAAHYRKHATDPWTRIGEQILDDLDSFHPPRYGLAVSSHVDGALARATFDHVTLGGRPHAMTSEDIGAVALGGSVSDDFVNLTVRGSGADIWGTADAFRFTYDGLWDRSSVTARVRSLTSTHRWAKAGVMVRANTSPGSPHVMVIVSPGKGVAMQYRRTQGGSSESTTPRAGAAPAWVRLTWDATRTQYVGWMSTDYATWTEIGRVTLDLGHQPLGGVAVTSHHASKLATAVFDDLHFGSRQ